MKTARRCFGFMSLVWGHHGTQRAGKELKEGVKGPKFVLCSGSHRAGIKPLAELPPFLEPGILFQCWKNSIPCSPRSESSLPLMFSWSGATHSSQRLLTALFHLSIFISPLALQTSLTSGMAPSVWGACLMRSGSTRSSDFWLTPS